MLCSFGDDITPPQQALDWILDLYEDVNEIVANGQTIIYSLHQGIGHLGIFVSGKVARKEHEEFAFNINLIDTMPPGLYEFVLTDAGEFAPRAELVEGKYIAKLEPRTLDHIRALGYNDAADQRRFETAARLSDVNQSLYRTCVRPIVRSLTTEASATFQREMHPNRVAFRAFSDQNPIMASVASAAERIKTDRHPVEEDNPFLAVEKMASSWIVSNLEMFARTRDAMMEATFLGFYGSPFLQAALGLNAEHTDARRVRPDVARADTRAELEADMVRGSLLEASLRALLYVMRGGGADERQFNALEALRKSAPVNERVPLSQLKAMLRRQVALLQFNEKEAVASIPKMLPDDPGQRARALTAIHEVITADGKPDPGEEERFLDVKRLFEGRPSKRPEPSSRPLPKIA